MPTVLNTDTIFSLILFEAGKVLETEKAKASLSEIIRRPNLEQFH